LRLAATAAAAEAGDSVAFVTGEADLRLPGGLPGTTILTAALADSVLARWPERPVLSRDPRRVGSAQLAPAAGAGGWTQPRDAMRRLLLLAGLLLLCERWLATRRGARSA
jgi:hypothetical protein